MQSQARLWTRGRFGCRTALQLAVVVGLCGATACPSFAAPWTRSRDRSVKRSLVTESRAFATWMGRRVQSAGWWAQRNRYLISTVLGLTMFCGIAGYGVHQVSKGLGPRGPYIAVMQEIKKEPFRVAEQTAPADCNTIRFSRQEMSSQGSTEVVVGSLPGVKGPTTVLIQKYLDGAGGQAPSCSVLPIAKDAKLSRIVQDYPSRRIRRAVGQTVGSLGIAAYLGLKTWTTALRVLE